MSRSTSVRCKDPKSTGKPAEQGSPSFPQSPSLSHTLCSTQLALSAFLGRCFVSFRCRVRRRRRLIARPARKTTINSRTFHGLNLSSATGNSAIVTRKGFRPSSRKKGKKTEAMVYLLVAYWKFFARPGDLSFGCHGEISSVETLNSPQFKMLQLR